MDLRRILVPLDGSGLAEDVLPAVRSLARRMGSDVVLLHVLERDPPPAVHGDRHIGSAADARAYLREQADALAGVSTEIDVHERPVDDVAAAIDAHAHEHHADLLAMCVHGRAGLRGRIVGSIAQRILRGGGTPILLRTSGPVRGGAFEPREILLPVDFRHDELAALDAARTIAAPYQARVTLLTTLVTPAGATGRLLPRAREELRRLEHSDVEQRLAELAAQLPEAHRIIREEAPATAILDMADALPADLVVLSTHARTGLSAWYERSTGQQLLTRPGLTLLLLREL